MAFTKYLEVFFDEKNLPYELFEIEASDGALHLIDNETVMETIAHAPAHEQKAIGDVIRKIDFANGDVNDFLKHLAISLVEAVPQAGDLDVVIGA